MIGIRSGWLKDADRSHGLWTRITSAGMYQLEYRRREPGGDRGWHLYGPNGSPFGLHMAYTVQEAKERADLYIFRPEQYFEDQ